MEDIFSQVRKSTAYCVSRSCDVKINHEQLKEYAAALGKTANAHWMEGFISDVKGVDLETQLRLAASLLFSLSRYWGTPKWGIPGMGGSNSLAKLYFTALKEGRLWRAEMTEEEYLGIIDCGNGVRQPRWKERWRILCENISFFQKKHEGSVSVFLGRNNYDLGAISNELLENCPNFRDVCNYGGKTIYFYKLLQMTVADLDVILKRNGHVGIPGASRRTAGADYKIPQILRYRGIIEYSPVLAGKVDKGELLSYGDSQEVEIRAATVQAVEEIAALAGVSASTASDQLWLDAQKAPREIKPHHCTDTLFY